MTNFWAPGSEIWIEDQLNRTLLLLFFRSLLMLWQDQHRSLERIHVPNWEVVDSLFRNANVKLRRQCHLWDDFGWDLSGDLGKTPKNPLGYQIFSTVIHGIPMIFKYRLWVSRYPMVSPMFRHTHVAKGQTAVQVRGHGRKRERSGGIQLGIKVTETVIIDAGDSLSSSEQW